MELKVAFKQKYRNVIKNKLEYKQNHFHDYSIITTPKNLNDDYTVKMTIEIYLQAQAKRDELHPPHQNRFFLFLVQHYLPRLHNIFHRAGATMEEYHQVLAYFDKKCAVHFARPNRRDVQMIRAAPQQTAEKRCRQDERLSQYKKKKNEDNLDNFDERSTMRASGSTVIKRKIMEDLIDVKKQHPGGTVMH
eukprot:6491400-Amphidinium_carterae.2